MTLYATAGVTSAARFEPVSGTAEANDTFFRIGDLARQFGVSLRTLRFYEDKGLLKPRRDGVTRLYTRRDKARLQLILLYAILGSVAISSLIATGLGYRGFFTGDHQLREDLG